MECPRSRYPGLFGTDQIRNFWIALLPEGRDDTSPMAVPRATTSVCTILDIDEILIISNAALVLSNISRQPSLFHHSHLARKQYNPEANKSDYDMRCSTLAALAAAFLTVGHATAGPVGADYHDGKLPYRDSADSVSSSGNTVDYPSPDDTGDDTTTTADAPASTETVDYTTVTKSAGNNVPGNAPPDFWMDKDHQVERPHPSGRHYEFMYCDRKFSKDRDVCGGTCNYVEGTMENGEITLFTPNTKCIVAPCDLEYQKCSMENHLMEDKMNCERAKSDGGPLANGMCLMKGGAHALRVAY